MRSKNRDTQSTPANLPDTPPPTLPSGDYSYTLEVVMNMQRSLGGLTEAINGLKEKQKDHDSKLDKVSDKLEGINRKIYAVIFLLVAIGAVLGFFGKTINDVITNKLTSLQQQTPRP